MATPRGYSLFELVQIASSFATSDADSMAAVACFINSGEVRLNGAFAGAGSGKSAAACVAPPSSALSPRYIGGSWLTGTVHAPESSSEEAPLEEPFQDHNTYRFFSVLSQQTV